MLVVSPRDSLPWERLPSPFLIRRIYKYNPKFATKVSINKNINIITELARESLRENADWILLHTQVSEKKPL
ncbi:MAG: hypothetical protein QXU18_00385 [Thermoplasmatales archaeon]